MSSPLISAIRPVGRVGILVVLSVALAACTSAASPTPKSTATPTLATPSTGSVPAAVPNADTSTGVASSGVALGSAGSAVAYPFYGGTPGAASDHSILVTGTGQAPEKADGSDAASAEKTALGKALAEAKRRADEIAAATGVTITAVLSVSESVGQGWIAPVGVESPGGVSVPPSGGTETVPAPPVPSVPSDPELEVTVTVAYSIGS